MSRPTVVIGGLGPADEQFLTQQTIEAAAVAKIVFLRTAKHPAAAVFGGADTFDAVYDAADDIAKVYSSIVERLVAAAVEHGEVLYLVPGSPLVAEQTVASLRADDRVTVRLLPAMSFLDLVWDRLGIDPFAAGPRLVDGRRFAVEAAGERGPLLVSQTDAPWVLSDVKLAFEDTAPPTVTVLQRLGLPDENVVSVSWDDLDRLVEPDHLTSLYIPEVASPVAFELARIEEVARTLRAKCPWDAEQTHESLGRYLLEETYELLEAIDHLDADSDEHFIEELGDLLFQVLAHSAIAAQQGRFTVADVAASVSDKLISRHPHVYGDVVAETADDVVADWEANKMKEKGRTSVMEGIPAHLPALLYASKVLKKAAGAGVEIDHTSLAGRGFGAALLILVDEIRKAGGDAEEELRRAANDFRRHFEEIER